MNPMGSANEVVLSDILGYLPEVITGFKIQGGHMKIKVFGTRRKNLGQEVPLG